MNIFIYSVRWKIHCFYKGAQSVCIGKLQKYFGSNPHSTHFDTFCWIYEPNNFMHRNLYKLETKNCWVPSPRHIFMDHFAPHSKIHLSKNSSNLSKWQRPQITEYYCVESNKIILCAQIYKLKTENCWVPFICD